MNIAVLKKDYSDKGGGAERYARELCRGLAAGGHKIFVHSQSFRAEPCDRIAHVRIPRTCLGGFSGTANFHRAVQKKLERGRYDIVYALSRTFPSDFLRVTESLHCEWMKVRYSHMQRFNPRHAGILKLEREIFKPSNTGAVICNSELARNQVVANFAYPPDRIFIVRNGVDHGEFRPAEILERREMRRSMEISEDDFAILFAASDFKIKGLEYAIRAIQGLPEAVKKRAILIVAGSGRPDSFKELAKKMGVGRNLRFIGRAARIRDCYVAADLLLHPALYEPFANVCLEALACGLPVLTTRTNGSSELIDEGWNGFTVPRAEDYVQMSQIIANFAESSESAKRECSENAAASVSGLTWRRHLDEIMGIFSRKSP